MFSNRRYIVVFGFVYGVLGGCKEVGFRYYNFFRDFLGIFLNGYWNWFRILCWLLR